MAKPYSPGAIAEYNKLNSSDRPVLLVEITDPNMNEVIRVAQSNDDFTHQGHTYVAAQFRASLPDDVEAQEPRATLEITNVGALLVDWIDQAGGGAESEIRFIQARPSAPDDVEYELTMDLANTTVNPLVVQGELSFDSVLNLPGIAMRHTPENTPGIF